MLFFVLSNIEVLVLILGISALIWALVLRIKSRKTLLEAVNKINSSSNEESTTGDGSVLSASCLKKLISPVFDFLSFLFVLALVLLLFVFVMFGFYGKREVVTVDPTDSIDFSTFGEVLLLLQENFPKFNEFSEEELGYGLVNGVINALGDPYTIFLDAEKSSLFMSDVTGEFEGIGVEIGIRNGNLQVISPLKNTPAYKAGLRAEDIIVAIDGDSTEKTTLEEAVLKIRGPRGEPVILSILRGDKIEEVTISRDKIKIPSIEWDLLDNNIAHIKLFHFHNNINREFDKISREIIDSSADKIILDLRNNPGGIFSGAVDVAGYFLERDSVAVIETDFKNSDNDQHIKTRRTPTLIDYDVVILINKGTASAAEIVAGALRDQRGVTIIGTESFGKGSIQQIFNIKDGSVVKITVKYFLTPNGDVINENGITPDIEVEQEEDDEDKDKQLQKAIEVIRQK